MNDNPRLVMSQGPQIGQTFTLDQDLLTLGRDPNNDIVINDPQVSRQHARLTRQGNLVVIEDVGSTNGTFVNGMRLTGPHTLAHGNVISLGDAVTLTYHGADIATTEPLAGRPTVSLEQQSYAPQPAPSPPSYEPPPLPPAYATPPPPAYATPYPSSSQPVEEEKKSKKGLWIGCGCLTLILACVAVAIFIWYAPASFWQTLIDLGIPIPAWPF